jgi:hypothetical protein
MDKLTAEKNQQGGGGGGMDPNLAPGGQVLMIKE